MTKKSLIDQFKDIQKKIFEHVGVSEEYPIKNLIAWKWRLDSANHISFGQDANEFDGLGGEVTAWFGYSIEGLFEGSEFSLAIKGKNLSAPFYLLLDNAKRVMS